MERSRNQSLKNARIRGFFDRSLLLFFEWEMTLLGWFEYEGDLTSTSIFFFPVVLRFLPAKKNHRFKKNPGNDLWKLSAPKKIKKRYGIYGHHHSPSPSLAVDIVGPFLYDPFRRLTPTASTGMPGRGRAPVCFSLFIIRIEFF